MTDQRLTNRRRHSRQARATLALAALTLLSAPAMGQGAPPATPAPSVMVPAPSPDNPGIPPLPAPSEIVAAAPASDWVAIPASDLLVMTLTPDARGRARRVVIQLMPAPFSQGWVANIRTLAAAHWWDGLAVTRVQDNYVAQWGDPDGEDPVKARALPQGLRVMGEAEYQLANESVYQVRPLFWDAMRRPDGTYQNHVPADGDPYSQHHGYVGGMPLALDIIRLSGLPDPNLPVAWPVHCYGMVGVGRGMSPDTGSGAELYTVIGHAPRHLDRNIALVGRVVEGIEHLSSLPRGTGPLGFYETAEERTTITSIRLASELPAAEQPRMEYLGTSSGSFIQYADARANRRDPFFIVPAGGADICNIPVPVRRVRAGG